MPDSCTIEDLERRINKLEVESGSFDVSLKKDIERLQREIEFRFQANDKQVNLALSSAKEASGKTDTAMEKRFEGVNEFRGQLDDQAKTFVPRAEVTALFKSFEDKIEVQRRDGEKIFDKMNQDISSLRESRSVTIGKDTGISAQENRSQVNIGYVFGTIGIIIAIVTFIMNHR